MKPFADHFSRIAASYATYRPHYPEALFAWLASIAPDRARVWDCATGNGQAAVALSRQFAHVIATDPSSAQIASAQRVGGIDYAVMTAERPAIAAGAVALVTVAQALHWFDRPRFFAEARRALAPRGIIAVWTYGPCSLGDPALDAAMRRFHDETVGPYWPAERALVVSGLAGVEFPFDELRAPAFAMTTEWTLAQFVGYLTTWSAVQRARAQDADPIPAIVEELRAGWASDAAARRIEWPLSMRVGRV
ncbi:MAG: class I SAM-dependent methyltransferase [Gemmatimonadetes bacterium]|nr:class I SAM-dependent methyltransferase [Gemmatimonadota bacterium]